MCNLQLIAQARAFLIFLRPQLFRSSPRSNVEEGKWKLSHVSLNLKWRILRCQFVHIDVVALVAISFISNLSSFLCRSGTATYSVTLSWAKGK